MLPPDHQGAVPRHLPTAQVTAPRNPYPWEGIAMIGGVLAFFLAGLLLRKGRKLDLPAT